MMGAIEEVIRCSVCLEKVRPPVVQCENGHGTCNQCKTDTVLNCPVCQQAFTQVPMRMLEQLLELLPKVCGFAEKGCTDQYAPADHHLFCEYRPLTCQFGGDNKCNWAGNFKEWVGEHIRSKHCSVILYCSLGEEKRISLKLSSTDYLLWLDDNAFWILVQKKGEMIHLTVIHIPAKKPNHHYYFTFTFEDSEVLYKSKLKPAILKGDTVNSSGYDTMCCFLKDLPVFGSSTVHVMVQTSRKAIDQ